MEREEILEYFNIEVEGSIDDYVVYVEYYSRCVLVELLAHDED